MFFEKLVEQHRVHLLVAHAVGLSIFVAHDQVGVYLFHFLGHKAKLRAPAGSIFFFVAERNRLKRKERLARFADRFDLLFIPGRGSHCSEPAA